jgi:NhaA family Na+:H+ antiporter
MSQELDPSARGHGGLFERFVHSQVSGSIVLLACTIVALVWANSPWADRYFELAHTYIGISWGEATFKLSLQHWVNDGLMVIFFFVVGLEIKREVVIGRLSTWDQAILPVTAAIGGMVVPALLYSLLNTGGEGAAGWGIPMATDIAFALGILALFGRRVPIGLKVFLTAAAIADDMGAVLVIAAFYTEKIFFTPLGIAAVLLFLIFVLNRAGVRRPGAYIGLMIGVWLAVFASGIHATVAGVVMAMLIPVRARIRPERFFDVARTRLDELEKTDLTQDSMIDDKRQLAALANVNRASGDMLPAGLRLENYLHPTQAFLILPLFALFNAGVAIDGRILETIRNPISIGVILGLVVGKPLGITLFSWLVTRTGKARLPEGVTWPQLLAVSAVAGVGFTMSLFISELAFSDHQLVSEAKVGILVASLLAGVCGYVALHRTLPREAVEGG